MQMTDEQKKLAEDNFNLIYSFINKHHLDPDIYYDVLMIELCKAAMDYDKTTGFSFSTFAYQYFLNAIRIIIRKSKRDKMILETISLDKQLGNEDEDDATGYKFIPDPSMTPEEIAIESDFLNDIFKCCTGKNDKTIINMILLGYCPSEIARYLSVSKQYIHTQLKYIRKRYEERRE